MKGVTGPSIKAVPMYATWSLCYPGRVNAAIHPFNTGTGRRHEPSLSMSDKIYCVKSEKIREKESKIHKWQQFKWGDLQSAAGGTCMYKTYCNVQSV